MLTKIAFFADPHMSDVAPESRLDNWPDTVLAKMKFILDTSNDKNVDAVVLLGDLFHRKNPNLNSHATNSKLIDLFKSSKAKIFSVVGNHDISMTGTNLDKQPIFVLERADALSILAYPYTTNLWAHINDVAIFGLAYSDRNEKFSDSYFEINEIAAKQLIDHKDVTTSILCLHQTLIPDGDSFFGDYLNFSEVKDMVFDIFCTGHFHPGFNPSAIKAHGKIFINPGAISRGSLGVHNIGRIPKFVILQIEDGKRKIEHINIPHEPAEVVFDLKKVEKSLIKAEEIKSFIQTIQNIVDSEFDISSVQGLKQLLISIGVDQEVVDFSIPYLEVAQEELK